MNLNMPWNSNKSAKGWTAPIEDVKQQIGQQVDHIVQVAAQVGSDVAHKATQVTSDAGSQAAEAARDLSGQALKHTQNAGSNAIAQAAAVAREVPKVARDIPGGASSVAQQVMDGAARLGREIRGVRVTRQPVPTKRGPDVIPGVALLAGIGSGLALMYFFDPAEGRRRRALLHDQLHKWSRIGRQTAVGKAHDVRNRTAGLAHEARKAVTARTGMDADMEQIASGSGSNTNGAGNGYGSTSDTEQTTEQSAERRIDQPQPSEVG